MIVLDTNIVSELMRLQLDSRLVQWLDSVERSDFWMTSISVFEIQFGIMLTNSDRKRDELDRSFSFVIADVLGDRILSFDSRSAHIAARLTLNQRRSGRSIEFRDTMIASIALAHDAPIVTRNGKHFIESGATLIDPWTMHQS